MYLHGAGLYNWLAIGDTCQRFGEINKPQKILMQTQSVVAEIVPDQQFRVIEGGAAAD